MSLQPSLQKCSSQYQSTPVLFQVPPSSSSKLQSSFSSKLQFSSSSKLQFANFDNNPPIFQLGQSVTTPSVLRFTSEYSAPCFNVDVLFASPTEILHYQSSQLPCVVGIVDDSIFTTPGWTLKNTTQCLILLNIWKYLEIPDGSTLQYLTVLGNTW